MDWWAERAGLRRDVAAWAQQLVAASLAVYNSVRRSLLPIPAKSHYTYNTRDLSKMFQGLSSAVPPPSLRSLLRCRLPNLQL